MRDFLRFEMVEVEGGVPAEGPPSHRFVLEHSEVLPFLGPVVQSGLGDGHLRQEEFVLEGDVANYILETLMEHPNYDRDHRSNFLNRHNRMAQLKLSLAEAAKSKLLERTC